MSKTSTVTVADFTEDELEKFLIDAAEAAEKEKTYTSEEMFEILRNVENSEAYKSDTPITDSLTGILKNDYDEDGNII